jgi:spermidine synthase
MADRMEAPRTPRRPPAAQLYVFAFASGAAALVYEVTWTKMLALTFGRTTLAASAVLAAFMGGMGIGAWLYARVRRRADPMASYAALEIGIAVSTAFLTVAFSLLPGFFAAAAPLVPAGTAMNLLRIGLVLGLLLLPAALMGATFPALCAALIQTRDGVGRHLGPIYGLNTLGAAFGALLAGFVLVEAVGLRGSVLFANATNGTIAWAAWRLVRRDRRQAGEVSPVGDEVATLSSALPTRLTGLVLAGSGFATLAYEILWFRALRYLFGSSTYAFTVMLVVFLIGLGLGGAAFRRASRRLAPERDLAFCQLAIALLALLAMAAQSAVLSTEALEGQISIFYSAVFARAWWLRVMIDAGFALAVMLPATFFMGLSFPLATRLYLGDLRRVDARVGQATLLANLGSIAGAVAAAVVILPQLGTVGGTRAVAVLNLALGAVVLLRVARPAVAAGWLGVAAVAMVLIWSLLPVRLSFQGGATIDLLQGELLFEEEGDLATVQVWGNPERPQHRAMTIDGTAIGVSAGWNYPLFSKQILLAHLPMALDRRIAHTLNVGLGSASTLDALATYPTLETLDAVEISAAVVRASRLFDESSVEKDPRVRIVVEDVSHFLLSTDRRYDLIISDGKQGSDFSGNSVLLCREFYEHALARLSPAGMLAQWIPMATPGDDVRTTLRTFAAVFPEMEVFMDGAQSMLMLGSREKIFGRPFLSPDEMRGLRATRDLAALRIRGRDALLSHWVAGREALLEAAGPGPISTWDRTRFEFSAYRTTPDDWAKAPGDNLAVLVEAHRIALAGGASPPVAKGSPFFRSTSLVRQALVERSEGRTLAARRLLERAIRLNPADARAAALLERSAAR